MNKELPKDAQEKITQLQMLEQAIQNTALQKQQLSAELLEIAAALKELESTQKAYKIIGNIMVSSDKQALSEELKKQKEIIEIKVKTLEKQESRYQEKAKSLQEEVMKNIKEEE